MEIVDIVNEQNEVIDIKSKDEAHRKGLLHRCVIAEVIDSQGNWTLVQQSSDRQDAGQFVSPVGGHIKSGESELDALKRETLEEVGIAEFQTKRIGMGIFNREVIGRKEHHLFILYELYTEKSIFLNHESVSYKKFSLEELKDQLQHNSSQFGEALFFVLERFYPNLLRRE